MVQRFQAIDYQQVDKKFGRLNWTPPPRSDAFLTFERSQTSSLLHISLKFVPPEFMTKILEDIDPYDCLIAKSSSWTHVPTISELYKVMDITIRIQGRHAVSQESTKNCRPKRMAITEAL
jgi:hypothetical protein